MLKIEDNPQGIERVRLLTFSRPEVRNAFNSELYEAVAEALTQAVDRSDIAVIVLTGEGSAYCAGQDLAEMNRLGSPMATSDSTKGAHGFTRFITAIESCAKPIVAAVNGVAVGVGTTMLPYCDLVLAATSARFRLPFASLGVVPEAGSSFTLPATMGWQASAHALFTGEWFDAATAHESGLVGRVVADDQLVGEALALAGAIAKMPVVSLVETKRLLLAGRLDAAKAARSREEVVFKLLTGAPANREAIAAFLEKRDPDFSNLPDE
jgi:enoyl-CoA hydratase/carnithine racemase